MEPNCSGSRVSVPGSEGCAVAELVEVLSGVEGSGVGDGAADVEGVAVGVSEGSTVELGDGDGLGEICPGSCSIAAVPNEPGEGEYTTEYTDPGPCEGSCSSPADEVHITPPNEARKSFRIRQRERKQQLRPGPSGKELPAVRVLSQKVQTNQT